jgi:hypothetical protein
LTLLVTCLGLPSSQANATDPINRANTNALPPNQFITTNSPPLSPAKFNPDSGVLPSRSQPFVPPASGLKTQWNTNAPPPPNIPPQFNPDPGAYLKSPSTNAPFFTNTVTLPPRFQSPRVPAELTLPRTNVRRAEIEMTNAAPGNFGHEPLPPGLELPRQNTRGNRHVKGHWHNPEYPHNWGDYPFPPNSEPVTNRWRIGFVPWRRYTSGSVEQP